MAGLQLRESKRLGKEAALHHPAPDRIIKKPERIIKGPDRYLSELLAMDAKATEKYGSWFTDEFLAIDAKVNERLSKFGFSGILYD